MRWVGNEDCVVVDKKLLVFNLLWVGFLSCWRALQPSCHSLGHSSQMFSLKSLLELVNVALVNSAISHPKFTFLTMLSQVKSSTSRTSSHVILRTLFMLKWPRGLAYVGKTSRAPKTRITEHRSAICNQDVTTPVAMHFKKAQHDIFTFRYIAIEVVKIPVQEATLSHCSWEENYTWFSH